MTTLQAANRGLTEFRSVAAVLYTQSVRVSGQLRSIHWRFSDSLNAIDQDFVMLHGAKTQPLQAGKAEAGITSALLIRTEAVVLALPRESLTGIERSAARESLRTQRVPLPALIEAWPFTITGTMHLPPGVDLLQHIHDPHHQFMPVTEASVAYLPSPLLSFEAPLLLVNRHNIQMVRDASLIGQQEVEDPDITQPDILDMALSGVRAAELLASTKLLAKADPLVLRQLCHDLCEGGLMGRRECRSEATVFVQGEFGDTLYVVESGRLAAFIRDRSSDKERQLACFGPGDLFGEMAVLGDNQRTASVRALSDAALLAVRQEAVQALMRRFPSVATGLLGVILERQAGLEAAHRTR